MKRKLAFWQRVLMALRIVGISNGSHYLILWNPLSWVLLFFGGLYFGVIATVAMYCETVTDSLKLGRYGKEKK